MSRLFTDDEIRQVAEIKEELMQAWLIVSDIETYEKYASVDDAREYFETQCKKLKELKHIKVVN